MHICCLDGERPTRLHDHLDRPSRLAPSPCRRRQLRGRRPAKRSSPAAPLAETQARLRALLPPHERFEVSEREPAYEVEVRPFLDHVFATTKSPSRYAVECRGPVCRVTSDTDMGEWMGPLQSDPKRFRGMQFGGHEAFIELDESDPDATELGRTMTRTALDGARTAIDACKRHHPQPQGTLEGSVQFLLTLRRLRIELRASLASQPFGSCVRRAIETAIAPLQISLDASEFSVPLAITVP